MNLILSDVEETIIIVDVEGAPEGTINVGAILANLYIYHLFGALQVAKRKMEMLFVRGDGVILVRPIF